MSLTRSDFSAFFAAVNDDATPFAWQERLLDHLLAEGRWPDRVVAPTGAGKTSVIDVHVFASALTVGGGPRLPRRLAMVVGRRVLVDDQHQRALRLADSLSRSLTEGRDDVVSRVASRLLSLRYPAGVPSPGADAGAAGGPLVVARLRGGTVPARAWRDEITACAVICATPDMWGSRLLFHGYGTTRLAAPREAGALAFDAAVVVDEAHLSGQLLVTARRVAELTRLVEAPVEGVPVLQVVETTATPVHEADDDTSSPEKGVVRGVGVEESDLEAPLLGDRLTRPKPVTLLPVAGWPPAGKVGVAANALSDAVVELLGATPPQAAAPEAPDRGPSRTVGCYVNTVRMAVAVAKSLRTRELAGQRLRVVMICGQTRTADLKRLEDRYPGLLSPAGNSEVDVIVTTQSLEVGVDLDLAGVVTELASGSALAQRAGRANRRGLRATARLVVAVPDEPITDKVRSGPYEGAELAAALAWVTRRAEDPAGLAPWALQSDPPPPAPPRRLYQRPELADSWHWARTSDDLAADPELDLWLAESFEEETSVGVVVRDHLPSGPDAAVLIRDLPPRSDEVFPVPFGTARSVLTRILTERGAARLDAEGMGLVEAAPVVRVRGEDVTVLALRSGGNANEVADVRPGDLVVIDSSVQAFTGGDDGAGGFSPYVVVADDEASPADDVSHLRREGAAPVVLRLELATPPGVSVAGIDAGVLDAEVRRLASDLEEATGERDRRVAVRDFLGCLLNRPAACSTGASAMVTDARALLAGPVKASDVLTIWDDDGGLVRVLVLDRRRAGADEELRQAFTTRPEGAGPVTLEEHQAAVAARAELFSRHVGLPAGMVEALRLAGAHHDDGKADPRFQIRLGATPADPMLAKSDPASTAKQVRERESLAGLPARWRHEQLSVLSWLATQAGAAEPEVDAELVSRLVGTSHGHGRSGFPHTTAGLLGAGGDERATIGREWFDQGRWDEVIERTQLRYGAWGCAYLESLLRAADGHVSREGS